MPCFLLTWLSREHQEAAVTQPLAVRGNKNLRAVVRVPLLRVNYPHHFLLLCLCPHRTTERPRKESGGPSLSRKPSHGPGSRLVIWHVCMCVFVLLSLHPGHRRMCHSGWTNKTQVQNYDQSLQERGLLFPLHSPTSQDINLELPVAILPVGQLLERTFPSWE